MLSVILLSYYSGERIKNVYEHLSMVMNENNIDFELIIIDDGSGDDSFQIALELENRFSNVKAYQLSKNYTSHYAIFAGLSVCNGDCAIPIPDDEQLPYQVVVESYKLWKQGAKVVIAFRSRRSDGIIRDFFSTIYYSLINKFSDISFPPGGADTFLIDRELIDIIVNKIHPINTSSIIEVLRLGFNPVFIPYVRPKGKHRSRWTFRKKVRLFKDTFFSSSTWPIRLITFTGMLFSLVALGFIIFYSYIRLFETGIIGVKYYPAGHQQ